MSTFSSTGAPQSLESRTAVVTGGGAGIGRAISQRPAREGARVAIFDLDGETATNTAKEIEAAGYRAAAYVVDVSNRAQIESAVERVRRELGPVGVLVNHAGIEKIGPFTAIDESTWTRIFAVNIFGMFHCAQVVIPDMIAGGWGRIVNISSSSAQRGAKNMVAYSSSKGAVISFTRSLALELGPHGITVNNIPPNFIVTPMLHKAVAAGHIPANFAELQTRGTPVGRPGAPEDIAAAVAFLASPEASYITAQTFGANGGRFP